MTLSFYGSFWKRARCISNQFLQFEFSVIVRRSAHRLSFVLPLLTLLARLPLHSINDIFSTSSINQNTPWNVFFINRFYLLCSGPFILLTAPLQTNYSTPPASIFSWFQPRLLALILTFLLISSDTVLLSLIPNFFHKSWIILDSLSIVWMRCRRHPSPLLLSAVITLFIVRPFGVWCLYLLQWKYKMIHALTIQMRCDLSDKHL